MFRLMFTEGRGRIYCSHVIAVRETTTKMMVVEEPIRCKIVLSNVIKEQVTKIIRSITSSRKLYQDLNE